MTNIGNDVWIRNNVTILFEVKVGDGAVIVAGAVVTKNVLPYVVVEGIPAQILKYRFDVELINVFDQLEWWFRDYEWIKYHQELLDKSEVNLKEGFSKFVLER